MTNYTQELEQRIRNAISLGSPAPSGFIPVECPICKSDEKKGGFKFESNEIVYHCFKLKCDSSCSYEEGGYVSKRFRRLMSELGVEIPVEILYANNKFKQKMQEQLNENLYTEFYPKEIDSSLKNYPDNLFEIDLNEDGPLQDYVDRRNLPKNKTYFRSTDKRWRGRLIVPSYYNGKMVGLIGRTVYSNHTPKYMTVSNGNLVYFREGHITDPLYIVEGVMDSLMLPNSLACNSDNISKKTAYLIKNVNNVTLIPDRDNPKFLDSAKKYGWNLCVPSWHEKDLNSAACRYGMFIIAQKIHESTYTPDQLTKAEVDLKMWLLNE